MLSRLVMIGNIVETSRHRHDIIGRGDGRGKYLQHDCNCKDHDRSALTIDNNNENRNNSNLGGHPKSLRECTREHRGADLVRRRRLSSREASAACCGGRG